MGADLVGSDQILYDQILYVSDAGADRVYKITRKVFTITHLARPNTLALGPWAEEPEVSAGGYGTADGELVSPGALALGEAVGGAAPPLFVSEGDRVSCFDADTLGFRFRFGRRGSAAGEFLSPAGLALGYNPLSPAGHGAELRRRALRLRHEQPPRAGLRRGGRRLPPRL